MKKRRNHCDSHVNVQSLLISTITKQNQYAVSFFGVYKPETISNGDLIKMRGDKWSNLFSLPIFNPQKDVTFRLWHNSLLTFKVAVKMGLCSSEDCPFCPVSKPNSFHMVHCASTQQFWVFLFELIKSMGIADKGDKLKGFEKSKTGNFLISLAHTVIYNRVLYYINSSSIEFDLIKSFKQRLSEHLVLDFGRMNKSENGIELFNVRWNNGAGLFQIIDKQLVIIL